MSRGPQHTMRAPQPALQGTKEKRERGYFVLLRKPDDARTAPPTHGAPCAPCRGKLNVHEGKRACALQATHARARVPRERAPRARPDAHAVARRGPSSPPWTPRRQPNFDGMATSDVGGAGAERGYSPPPLATMAMAAGGKSAPQGGAAPARHPGSCSTARAPSSATGPGRAWWIGGGGGTGGTSARPPYPEASPALPRGPAPDVMEASPALRQVRRVLRRVARPHDHVMR